MKDLNLDNDDYSCYFCDQALIVKDIKISYYAHCTNCIATYYFDEFGGLFKIAISLTNEEVMRTGIILPLKKVISLSPNYRIAANLTSGGTIPYFNIPKNKNQFIKKIENLLIFK